MESREWSILHAIQQGKFDIANVTAKLKRDGDQAIGRIREKLAADEAGPIPTFRAEQKAYLALYEKLRAAESLKDVRSRLNRIGRQR